MAYLRVLRRLKSGTLGGSAGILPWWPFKTGFDAAIDATKPQSCAAQVRGGGGGAARRKPRRRDAAEGGRGSKAEVIPSGVPPVRGACAGAAGGTQRLQGARLNPYKFQSDVRTIHSKFDVIKRLCLGWRIAAWQRGLPAGLTGKEVMLTGRLSSHPTCNCPAGGLLLCDV